MEEKKGVEHARKAAVPGTVAFVVASMVSLILFILERRGVIDDRKSWAPLSSMSSGICILAFGLKDKNKGMMTSGAMQLTFSTIGLARKRIGARSAGEESAAT